MQSTSIALVELALLGLMAVAGSRYAGSTPAPLDPADSFVRPGDVMCGAVLPP